MYNRGKNTGFSYKISWTNALSEDLTLTIGVNIIRYRFDAPQAPGGDNLDFDNNFTNTSITFNKYF